MRCKDTRSIERNFLPIRVFVSGGREYYGPTAKRDQDVVHALGECLYDLGRAYGYDIELVTGGTEGIPQDMAKRFTGPILDVVSTNEKINQDYRTMVGDQPNRTCFQIGASFKERRLGIKNVDNIRAVLVIQGGQYTTHELLLFQEQQVPIIALRSSGGAAGSKLPYEGTTWTPTLKHPEVLCDEQETDATRIAAAMYRFLFQCLEK